MTDLKVIWNSPAPRSYRRILFRFNEGRQWRFRQNWKCNLKPHKKLKFWHWNIITPFFRFQKCNGAIYLGLGNHYLE